MFMQSKSFLFFFNKNSLKILFKGGYVLVSEEVAEKLLPKFSRKADEMEQHIQAVENGTIEQLHELVRLVASNEV